MDLLEALDKGIVKFNEPLINANHRGLKGEITFDLIHYYRLVPIEEDEE